MAARYDVGARLTEGLPAVDDLQVYVDACRLRGYQHPDLTARIRDSYTAEEGLDLGVLDADCAALRGVADDVADALRLARSQAAALADTWTGPGGMTASDFIVRQCDTASVVDDAIRTAADACVVLRDDLWRLVDRRVSVTQEIAERARAARPEWLAAAHAVLAGQADQGDAGEIVDNQVTPFVDNAVRLDWVGAMRLADRDAVAAYRSAVDAAVGSAPQVSFEVPGDLGPRHSDARPATVPATAATALTDTAPALPSAPVVLAGVPEEFSSDLPGPAGGNPMVPAAVPPVAAPNPLDALASAPPLSPLSGMPGLGTPTMPELGGGIGAPGRFADTLGSLLGTPTGTQIPDLLDVPELDVPDEPGEPDALVDDQADADEDRRADDEVPEEVTAGDDLAAADDEVDAEPAGTAEPAEPPTEVPAEAVAESDPAPTDPVAKPACDPPPTPPPAAPPLPSEPGATPCEIAADELPQAGQ